jgi:hypothetical protein
VTGQALTRRDLLLLLDKLRADTFFAAVDSPVSNLIKETKVPFNVALSLNLSL